MFTSLIIALAFGQAHGLVAKAVATPANTTIPMFIKDSSSGKFMPYDAFDYPKWVPQPSLYDGLPMVEKTIEVDGQTLVYQDFNISALGVGEFKAHYMNASEFYDANGKFIPSNGEVEAYQASLIAHEENPDAEVALPNHFSKRACVYDGDRCSSQCTNLISRGIRQSINTDVYGAYHYVSDSQCGTGSISKSVSVTHVSGVTLGGYAQIPGFGKGWVKAASTFFSTFGFSPSKGADSVTTGIIYAGNCGPFNVCFLWERPHFSVDKGVIVTQFIDVGSKRACRKPQVTPYEAHIMHSEKDPGGATTGVANE
ncbi:hypothetical protein FDECE_14654 [Fusarium decemcellulare]|nr:hypothetical protein FDECE_14654 [Fusarium decemcellulare]